MSSVSSTSENMGDHEVCLRLFLNSRPDLPVRLKLQTMSVDAYHALILQDATSQSTIQHDLSTDLQDAFSISHKEYNKGFPPKLPFKP